MSRLKETFAQLRGGDGAGRGLIPFIVAGDPDLATTRDLIIEMARAGAHVIELGVPFSDPVADGPVVQRAAERALANRVGVAEVLAVVEAVRGSSITTPIILFSYYNPLLQFGLDRLGVAAERAGVDGILVTDLVPEEAGDFAAMIARHDLDQIYLAAPTSTDARLQMIAERAGGFIYAVSRAGVTGARTDLSAEAEKLVARLRRVSTLPVAVGFGISTGEQVGEVWRYADAAVVGSAIVAEIEKHGAAPDLVARIGAFTRRLLPRPGGDLK